MPLQFVEVPLDPAGRNEALAAIETVATAAGKAGGGLLEAQVTASNGRVFAVAEVDDAAALSEALDAAGVAHEGPSEVRLVGASVEEVRARAGRANYLVEWDLPAELTMDAYLARKKANSAKYAEVPEVAFLRTYVREDMGKCLCFYDGPDAETVCRARNAVGAPVDRLHALESLDRG
jgi:hypothetical protein